MSADSPRRHPSGVGGAGGIGLLGGGGGGHRIGGNSGMPVPATVPPQTVSDRSILDSAIGFINDVTLAAHQPQQDPKDTITWARFETCADVSDPRFGDDWELEGNAAPPLLLILGYGLGVQVWAIPANGEAVEVLSWRHGVVTALRVLPTPTASSSLDENGRADEPVDSFAEKRPLVALVDGGSAPSLVLGSGAAGSGGLGGVGLAGSGSSNPLGVGAGNQFSAVNFVSLKTGVQVKTIKFKNAVLDIQANRSAVAITFHERIAVFDARTLEDRLTITTCYPSPGINPNPIALGPRWLAYAENKLLHSKRSGGGCDGEGVPSYTATVLNAAKSFGKGLRELGEQVAAGLTGGSSGNGANAGSGTSSKSGSFDSASGGAGDFKQSGVVTIIDVKHPIKDYSPTTGTPLSSLGGHCGAGASDPIVAHFIAHSEALVAMEFDSSGMLLLTADRRGHDFHVFRIQPHPVGSSLAAVHHLYVLHRGDTSAKVQHIAFSLDSRWAAVSTLRGTTHVFPITPYGGAMGVRTHTSLHVVNKLSRFHRSAGLGADGRSSSPISHSESTTFVQSLQPYHNPTLPPFPRPTVVQPLAQLRQPFSLGSPPGSGGGVAGMMGGDGCAGVGGHHGHANASHRQRQRLSSLSDDSGKPLSVCSIFAKSRSWLLEPPTATREAPHRIQRKAVDSLFVMAGHGALIQYDLDTKLASNVAKEKICDDTPIELEVEARAQWNLGRRKDGSHEIIPPLAMDNWLIKDRHHASLLMDSLANQFDEPDERAESWLAQVEIITHAGPHRRLWMGPQFVFKNYNTPSGSNLNHVDTEAVEIGVTKTSTTTLPSTAAGGASSGLLAPASSTSSSSVAHSERSSPLNMPLSGGSGGTANASNVTASVAASAVSGRSGVPVLIESGSYSSIEQSPKLMDRFRHGHLDSDYGHGDMRLKEDLADAMRESPSTAAARRETTGQMPVTTTATATMTTTATATTTTLTTMTMTMTTSTTTLSKSEAISSSAAASTDNVCYYDALTEYDDHEDLEDSTHLASADERQSNDDYQMEDYHFKVKGAPHFSSTLASVLPNICSFEQQQQHQQHQPTKIEKIVNPLGTVTDVNAGLKGDLQTDILDKVVCQLANEETVIHENCDEALFRPVVAIFCDDLKEQRKHEKQLEEEKALAEGDNQRRGDNALIKGGNRGKQQPPVVLVNKLVVPVIAKEVDEVLVQKEKQQQQKSHKSQQRNQTQAAAAAAAATAASVAMAGEDLAQALKFAELSHLNKPQKTAERIIKKDNEKQQQQMPEVLEKFDDSVIASPAPATPEVVVKEVKKKEEKMESSALLASKTSTKKSKAKSKGNQKDIKKISLIDVDKEEKVNNNKKDKEEDKVLVAEAKSLDKKEQPPKEDTEKESKSKKTELQSETDFDLELDCEDYADNLLANKTNIAALMISSATAQGLNLQVETTSNSKADEEEESDNRELEEGSAMQMDRKKDLQIDLKAKLVDKPIEAAAKDTKDDDTMKIYKVKVIEEDVKRSSPSKTAIKISSSSSSSPWRQSLAPKSSIQSNEEYPSLAPNPTTKKLPARSENFHDFLKTLPPLPALEPLEMGDMVDLELNVDDIPSSPAPSSSPTSSSAAAAGAAEAITPPTGSGSAMSLINFESPLQEQKESLSRKITPPPRGFTEQNLIFALCGSLHYENEQQIIEAAAGSNLNSHMNSNSNSNSNSNTNTNTNSYTHSNTSSGSEEIILMEESISSNKKLSKKQKRKQQKAEAKAAVEAEDQAEDEELRPLISISMCDSQMEMSTKIKDHIRDGTDDDGDDGNDENVKHERNLNQSLPEDLLHFGSSGVALTSATNINTTTITTSTITTSTTTTTASSSSIINPNATTKEDSEDPLPATTSDDNLIFSLSSSNHHHNTTPHKLKTKKLEHKINLIAAIEAATSSSTSSAEESSVETSSNPVNSLADILPSVLSSLPASSSTSSLCTAQTQATHLNTSSTASGGPGGVLVGLGGMPLGGGIGSVGVSMGMAGQTSATKKKTKRRKR